MFVTLQLVAWPEIKDSQRSKTRAPQEQSSNDGNHSTPQNNKRIPQAVYKIMQNNIVHLSNFNLKIYQT